MPAWLNELSQRRAALSGGAAAPDAQLAQSLELLQAACRCLWRNRCANP
jgi:hypothetical protein